MDKVHALFYLSQGGGNRIIFICPITEQDYELRFGGNKEYLKNTGCFYLAEAEVNDKEVWDVDAVEWKLPFKEIAKPDPTRSWPNCILQAK